VTTFKLEFELRRTPISHMDTTSLSVVRVYDCVVYCVDTNVAFKPCPNFLHDSRN